MPPRTPEGVAAFGTPPRTSTSHSRAATPITFAEPLVHLHRQSIVPASPPGSAFGNLGSSQTLSSTQQRTGIESQCSIHEDKSLQGAVLAGRHGRTEEQVTRIVQWLCSLQGMQDAIPGKLTAAVHMSTGTRLLLHQVVYKAGRPAEDIYFVVRGRILLREGRSATAATAPSAPPPGAIAEPPSGAAPSGGSGGTASTTSTATLGGAPAAGGSDMTDPDASVDVLAGSWFGEAELLAGCKRKYTAEAAENGSVVLKMPAQAYMLCMEEFRTEQFNAKVQYLSELAPLKGLALSVLKHISPCFQLVEFKQGELLVRQGERADSMYAIKEGVCAVFVDPHFKLDAPGNEVRVAEVDPKKVMQVCMLSSSGSIIGEAAIYTNVRKRTASVVAHTAVQAYRIHRTDLLRYLPTDQIELLRLIASEKVQMMDQSVSARQHMRDQILHGRHLREISLEQQRVQQQRKGMPPSGGVVGAPGHEEYWQMMTVLKRYKRPTAPHDAGAPNMVLGLAPPPKSLSDDHRLPRDGPSKVNLLEASKSQLHFEESAIMAELQIEPSSRLVMLDAALETARSRQGKKDAEQPLPEGDEQALPGSEHGSAPATEAVAGTSAVAFSRSAGGIPGGEILAADESEVAPLWRPVAAPPVNTRSSTTAAESLAAAAAMGPGPVTLTTVTPDAPEWGATSRSRVTQSKSPLRQLLQSDLANCWATHEERTPYLSRSVSRCISAKQARSAQRSETGAPMSVSASVVFTHSVSRVQREPRTEQVDMAAAVRMAQQELTPRGYASKANSPTYRNGYVPMLSPLVLTTTGPPPPVPLSSRPQWGKNSGIRITPSAHVMKGSPAAVHRSLVAMQHSAAAAAAAATAAQHQQRSRASSLPPASRSDAVGQQPLVTSRLGDATDLHHAHQLGLGLIEFSVLPPSARLSTPARSPAATAELLRQGAPTFTKREVAIRG